MTSELIIRVPGDPVAWARGGRRIMQPKVLGAQAWVKTFTPKKVQDWEDHVAHWAQKAAANQRWITPDRNTPLCVDEDFHYRRPSTYRKHEIWKRTTPDRDNLDKAILDALKYAGLMHNDGVVCDGRVRKFIDEDWQGVVIRISEADCADLPIGHKSQPMPTAQEAMAI